MTQVIVPQADINTQFVHGHTNNYTKLPAIWCTTIPLGPIDGNDGPMAMANFWGRALATINNELKSYKAQRNDFRITASIKWGDVLSREGVMMYRSSFVGSNGTPDHGDIGLRLLEEFVRLGGNGLLRIFYYEVPE